MHLLHLPSRMIAPLRRSAVVQPKRGTPSPPRRLFSFCTEIGAFFTPPSGKTWKIETKSLLQTRRVERFLLRGLGRLRFRYLYRLHVYATPSSPDLLRPFQRIYGVTRGEAGESARGPFLPIAVHSLYALHVYYVVLSTCMAPPAPLS